jgi:two-component system LytT family response regulator
MKCIIIDDDSLTRGALELFAQRNEQLEFSGSFDSAVAAFDFLQSNPQDIIFLDVEMSGMNGFELLEKLGEDAPIVIMVTAHSKYAVGAFDSDVADFLVKPITPARFQQAVDKAAMHLDMKRKNEQGTALVIKTSEGMVKIAKDEILYIKSLADYVTIYTAANKYTTHSTLKGILNRVGNDQFVRAHHSFIVRIDKIAEVDINTLRIGTVQIPISRSRRKEVGTRFKEYFG